MWLIYKQTKGQDKQLVTTADCIDMCHDVIVSEGGHKTFYNGEWFMDCKRATRIGDTFYEVKYECGARVYKVYGNLWVAMDHEGHQIYLGTFQECEDKLYIHEDEDMCLNREIMRYKGKYEDCEYIAVWKEDKE